MPYKKVKNGVFSTFATTILKEGDTLEASKPEGRFVLETSENNSKNYLAIAAGSGITPILSMIKSVLTEEPNSTFTLIFGNKTVADTIFKTILDGLKNKYPTQLNIQYVYSREQQADALFGRIDKGIVNFVVKNKYQHLSFNNVFLCGPEEMITAAKTTLIENNFDENTIYFELFSSANDTLQNKDQQIEGKCEVTVILDDEETSFTMDVSKTLLSSALKEGIDAPYSCQGGICSSCLAKITEGNAVMEKNSILSDSEVNDGYVLTCQAHPTTQKIRVDYDEV